MPQIGVEKFLVIDCPHCGAKRGSYCKDPDGEGRVHVQRIGTLMRALDEPDTSDIPERHLLALTGTDGQNRTAIDGSTARRSTVELRRQTGSGPG